jgi:hypothetical protein
MFFTIMLTKYSVDLDNQAIVSTGQQQQQRSAANKSYKSYAEKALKYRIGVAIVNVSSVRSLSAFSLSLFHCCFCCSFEILGMIYFFWTVRLILTHVLCSRACGIFGLFICIFFLADYYRDLLFCDVASWFEPLRDVRLVLHVCFVRVDVRLVGTLLSLLDTD